MIHYDSGIYGIIKIFKGMIKCFWNNKRKDAKDCIFRFLVLRKVKLYVYTCGKKTSRL